MKKLKDIIVCTLYVIIIYLSQKIVFYLYSFLIFKFVENGNSFILRMYFSSNISIHEKALKWINDTKMIYIFVGWVIGVALIYCVFKAAKQPPLPYKKRLGIVNLLYSTIIGLGIVLITNGLVNSIISYFDMEPFFFGFGGSTYFINILIVVGIITPIFEEIVFRGFILTKLSEDGSKWFAIVVQALMFSISHFNIHQGASVFLLGIAAGYATIKTKSIKSGIVIHIVFNLINLYLYKMDSSYYNLGQLIIFIVIGIVLTYLGFEKLTSFARTKQI